MKPPLFEKPSAEILFVAPYNEIPSLASSPHHHYNLTSPPLPLIWVQRLFNLQNILWTEKANKTPCSPLISVQLPRSAVLLTEHQIEKVSQLYICGLQENFPPLKRVNVHLPSFLQCPTLSYITVQLR